MLIFFKWMIISILYYKTLFRAKSFQNCFRNCLDYLDTKTDCNKRRFGANPIKLFNTLGQIYKNSLKQVNNAKRQTFVSHNVRTLHPNIFI